MTDTKHDRLLLHKRSFIPRSGVLRKFNSSPLPILRAVIQMLLTKTQIGKQFKAELFGYIF